MTKKEQKAANKMLASILKGRVYVDNSKLPKKLWYGRYGKNAVTGVVQLSKILKAWTAFRKIVET